MCSLLPFRFPRPPLHKSKSAHLCVVVVQDPAGVCKVRVFGVDVGQLDGDQVVHLRRQKTRATFGFCSNAAAAAAPYHLVGHGQPLPQEGRHRLRDGLVQLGEPLQLLPDTPEAPSLHLSRRPQTPRLRAAYLRAVVAAVLDDPLHLLVDQLHAAQARLLQAFHLLLHQQLKRHLGHKQGRTRALGKGREGAGRAGRASAPADARPARHARPLLYRAFRIRASPLRSGWPSGCLRCPGLPAGPPTPASSQTSRGRCSRSALRRT